VRERVKKKEWGSDKERERERARERERERACVCGCACMQTPLKRKKKGKELKDISIVTRHGQLSSKLTFMNFTWSKTIPYLKYSFTIASTFSTRSPLRQSLPPILHASESTGANFIRGPINMFATTWGVFRVMYMHMYIYTHMYLCIHICMGEESVMDMCKFVEKTGYTYFDRYTYIYVDIYKCICIDIHGYAQVRGGDGLRICMNRYV